MHNDEANPSFSNSCMNVLDNSFDIESSAFASETILVNVVILVCLLIY